MKSTVPGGLLWWMIPGVLAGMPMPFIHPDRRIAGGGGLYAWDDELPDLYAAGVRAIVSLLNIPTDASVYASAGFGFLCLPVQDGNAPTFEQADSFLRFMEQKEASKQPVAVHCQAGLGRTGTFIAAYLISRGDSAHAALARVRSIESGAVETLVQLEFLDQYARRVHSKTG